MLDVLCPLITESDIVSNELLDIILMNIVEPNKSSKKNAYLLAKELVIKCSDTLEPYIQAVSCLVQKIVSLVIYLGLLKCLTLYYVSSFSIMSSFLVKKSEVWVLPPKYMILFMSWTSFVLRFCWLSYHSLSVSWKVLKKPKDLALCPFSPECFLKRALLLLGPIPSCGRLFWAGKKILYIYLFPCTVSNFKLMC